MGSTNSPSARPRVCVPPEELVKLIAPSRKALIIKVLGRTVGYNLLTQRIKQLWHVSQYFEAVDVGEEYYLVRCACKEYYLHMKILAWNYIGARGDGTLRTICKLDDLVDVEVLPPHTQALSETIRRYLQDIFQSGHVPLEFNKTLITLNTKIDHLTRKQTRMLRSCTFRYKENNKDDDLHLFPLPRSILGDHKSLLQLDKNFKKYYIPRANLQRFLDLPINLRNTPFSWIIPRHISPHSPTSHTGARLHRLHRHQLSPQRKIKNLPHIQLTSHQRQLLHSIFCLFNTMATDAPQTFLQARPEVGKAEEMAYRDYNEYKHFTFIMQNTIVLMKRGLIKKTHEATSLLYQLNQVEAVRIRLLDKLNLATNGEQLAEAAANASGEKVSKARKKLAEALASKDAKNKATDEKACAEGQEEVRKQYKKQDSPLRDLNQLNVPFSPSHVQSDKEKDKGKEEEEEEEKEEGNNVLNLTEEDEDKVSKSTSSKKADTSKAEIAATSKSLNETLKEIDEEITVDIETKVVAILSTKVNRLPTAEVEQIENTSLTSSN
ncbi:hypothetical protein CsSME_00040107 [Camellia sinensis var. sinensis]